jgi:hypothetical protein
MNVLWRLKDMLHSHCEHDLAIEVVEHSVTPTWDDDTSLGPIYVSWKQTIAQVEQVSGRSFSLWRESAQLLEGSGLQDIIYSFLEQRSENAVFFSMWF